MFLVGQYSHTETPAGHGRIAFLLRVLVFERVFPGEAEERNSRIGSPAWIPPEILNGLRRLFGSIACRWGQKVGQVQCKYPS